MKAIPLTQGKVALVDDADFAELSKFKWMAVEDTRTFYAARHSPSKTRKLIYMHRVIMKTPEKLKTDHIDGNGLNNRRKNLRICTDAENARNRQKPNNNTSGLKCVSFYKKSKKWQAYIGVNKKQIHLGYFKTKEDALIARISACEKYHGEFKRIN